eukprot:gene11403-15285_t
MTTAGYVGDGGPATAAQLKSPSGLYVTTDGTIYIADRGNNVIRKVDGTTNIITTFAGVGTAQFSGDGSVATAAQLNGPYGVWVDESRSLVYIADTANDRIRTVPLSTKVIRTACGSGITTINGDGIVATAANIQTPRAVVTDTNGNFYFSSRDQNRVCKVTISTGILTNLAGYSTRVFNGDNILAIYAQLSNPVALWVNTDGTVYIADTRVDRLRKIDPTTSIITTFAGTGVQGTATTTQEGFAATATALINPPGMSFDSDGNAYFTESHRVRVLLVSTKTIYTIAGQATNGFNGNGIAATSAPSDIPTMQPSGRPSLQPYSIPTGLPSMQPKAFPTNLPTPTTIPMVAPTSTPTLQKTEWPTSLPSIQPFNLPTNIPSSDPTVEPSYQASSIPSSGPSSFPSGLPTSYPTKIPSIQPTSTPSTIPTGLPSSSPSFNPTLQPSHTPSVQPMSTPTGFPTYSPSAAPNSAPTASPTVWITPAPTQLSKIISFSVELSPTNSKYQANVNVTLSGSINVLVYCGVYSNNLFPFSTAEIIAQNNFAVSTFSKARLCMDQLKPLTSYSIFCLTKGFSGESMTSLDEAISTQMNIVTSCCKKLIVSGIDQYSSAGIVLNAVKLTVQTLPSALLIVQIHVKSSQSNISANILPSSLIFTNQSSFEQYISIQYLISDTYYFTFEILGESSNEYQIEWQCGNVTVVLDKQNNHLQVNQLSAYFSEDGSYVKVVFNAATNRGGYTSQFPCSALFEFIGNALAMCIWNSDSSVSIYGSNMTASSSIRLIEDNGLCGKDTLCTNETNAITTTIYVQTPFIPLIPTVTIVGPNKVSTCSNVTVDTSFSSGSGGRPWRSVTFYVSSSSSIDDPITNYLNRNYKPTMTIPYWFLKKLKSYAVSVQMCNFLDYCNVDQFSFEVQDYGVSLPLIVIQGSKYREIKSIESLTLYSSLYYDLCFGDENLYPRYYWLIADQPAGSISRDPSILRLPPSTLAANNLYTITLTIVYNTSTPHYTSYSIYVRTVKSDLFSSVNGGAFRTISNGDMLSLDGRSSFDPDRPYITGIEAGLSFIWSCFQSFPSLNGSCPFQTYNRSYQDKGLFNLKAITPGLTGTITLTVLHDTRSATYNVVVNVLEKQTQNRIQILSLVRNLTYVPTSRILAISGSVEVQTACEGSWSVRNDALDLSAISISPLSSFLLSNVKQNINLVIGAHALPRRSSFIFTLNCQDFSSSIGVSTNGPPIYGVFEVEPKHGTEILTNFYFAADSWFDEDLPISYQFSINTFMNDIDNLIVREQMHEPSFQSVLPSGSSSLSYQVLCGLKVYDNFGDFSDVNQTITVNPTDKLDQASLSGILSKKISPRVTMSLILSYLNKANCSLALNCSSLHRYECSKTQHTCGACLDGFIGRRGDYNDQCLPNDQFNSIHCDADTDCPANKLCGSDHKCQFKQQKCLDICDNHGECVLRSRYSGLAVTTCEISDDSCQAVCSCLEGFTGIGCEMSFADFSPRHELRQHAIQLLSNLTMSDDVVEENVISWSYFLRGIALNSIELQLDDINEILSLAVKISTVWRDELDLPFNRIANLLQIIDSIANSAVFITTDTNSLIVNSILYERLQLLNIYGKNVLSQMEYGQYENDFIFDSFRMSTNKQYILLESSEMYNIPLTTLERLQSVPSSSVELTNISNSNLQSIMEVSLLTASAASYGNISNILTSNPIQITINSDLSLNGDIVLVMRNNYPVEYVDSSFNFTTICDGVDTKTYRYICPVSSVNILHNCTYRKGSFVSYCPVYTPSCSVLQITQNMISPTNDQHNCSILFYNASVTKCACSMNKYSFNSNKRILATTTSAVNGLQSSVLHAATFRIPSQNVNNVDGFNRYSASTTTELTNSLKIFELMVFISSVWAVSIGYIVIGVFYNRKPYEKENVKSNKKNVFKNYSSSISVLEMKDLLETYVSQLFPSVFSSKPFMYRLYDEVKKHHRYLLVLRSESGDAKRILTGIQLLSVQTMLMFLLALLYDLQRPFDDGLCGQYISHDACLLKKSVFDRSQSYCKWQAPPPTLININDDPAPYTCELNNFFITAPVFIIIFVLTSILTMVLKPMIFSLFDIVATPTVKSKKIHENKLDWHANEDKVKKNILPFLRRFLSFPRNQIHSENTNSMVDNCEIPSNSHEILRYIPTSIQQYHSELSKKMEIILPELSKNISDKEERKKVSFVTHSEQSNKYGIDYDEDGDDSDSEDDEHKSSNNSDIIQNYANIFEKMLSEIHLQRRLLKANERDDFDIQW